eukprot:g27.t1
MMTTTTASAKPDEETADPPIIMKGFLTKRSISGTVGSSWRRRYFVLKHDVVLYYVRKDDQVEVKPRGILLIAADAKLDLYTGARHTFQINSANRTLVAQCDSRRDLEAWLGAFRTAIAIQRCTSSCISQIVHCNGVLHKKSISGSGYSQRRWFELVGQRLYYFKMRGGEPLELCRALTLCQRTKILAGGELARDRRSSTSKEKDRSDAFRRSNHSAADDDYSITLLFRDGTKLEMNTESSVNYSRWTRAFGACIKFAQRWQETVASSLIVSCRNLPRDEGGEKEEEGKSTGSTRGKCSAAARCNDEKTRLAAITTVKLRQRLRERHDIVPKPAQLMTRPVRGGDLSVMSPSVESIRENRALSIKLVKLLPHLPQLQNKRRLQIMTTKDTLRGEATTSVSAGGLKVACRSREMRVTSPVSLHAKLSIERSSGSFVSQIISANAARQATTASRAATRFRSILNDLDRTSESSLFKGERRGQKLMYHVLKCVALRDAELGYCQGMNWIAAAFIEVACADVSSKMSLIRNVAMISAEQRRPLPSTPDTLIVSVSPPITTRNSPRRRSGTGSGSRSKKELALERAMARSIQRKILRRSVEVCFDESRSLSPKGPIVKQGWLRLDKRKNDGVVSGVFGFFSSSSEERYWVVLQPKKLSWFVRKRVSVSRVGEPHGVFALSFECSVRISSLSVDRTMSSFEIHSPNGTFIVLRSSGVEERSSWIEAIRSVLVRARADTTDAFVLSPEVVLVAAREAIIQLVREDRTKTISFPALERSLSLTVGARAFAQARGRVMEEFPDMVERARARYPVLPSDSKFGEDALSDGKKIERLGTLEAEDYARAEKIFWMFVAALEHPSFGLRNLFISEMPQLEFCLFAFEELLRLRNKKVCSALTSMKDELQIPIFPTSRLYATQWFMTFFARDFPLELSLRVWDVFLLEGSWAILFKVALSVLELAQNVVLKSDFERSLQYLQQELPFSVDAEALMRRALSVPVSDVDLLELRAAYRKRGKVGVE